MSGIGCPTREELTSFVLGEIAEADADAISRHLEGCERCEATLTELDGSTDRLIDLCRQPAPMDRYSQEAACHDAVTRAIALGGGFDDATEVTPAEPGRQQEEEDEEPILGQMGDYKLVEELSHGGMGTVYRAVHIRLGREVALKVLPKGRHTDQRAVARFEREMAAVGKLDHPHIVRATDAGEVEGVQYLAMELIEGFDLTELVDYLGPLGVVNSCDIIRQAALGLQCAYEQGLVHRDIKPSNVMVTDAGIAKILDLGLARFHIDKQSNVELTTAGQPMGTADYMAPEQVADTHSVDIRADIYSLGCTFYKILAGQPPFGGVQYSSSFDKMMAHRKETPPSIQEFRPDLPKKVVAILEQMLAKDPDERFQRPIDLADSLFPLCAGANLKEMVESAWDAAATAPTPQSTATATSSHGEEPSTAPQRRAKRRVQTAGSSTHSKSRSQYSNFYVMPPPAKPQWALWLMIGVLSSLLVGIVAANITTWFLNNHSEESPPPRPLAGSGWNVPQQPSVEIPAARKLTGKTGRPLRVRGAMGKDVLVSDPAPLDGVASWTLETVGHRTPILCAAASPKGEVLATGSGEGAVRLWDLKSGQLRSILINPDNDGPVRSLAWAPGGDYLATAYEAGKLIVWDTRTGNVLPEDFNSRSTEPNSLAWSPDGTVLAYIDKRMGQDDFDDVMLWDFKANTSLQPLSGAKGRLQVIAYSPDGTRLAAGGSDRLLHVWDLASGREQVSIAVDDSSHGPISALAWSPCATMIASSCDGGGSYQGTTIWSLEDASQLGNLQEHLGGDQALVWLADPPILIGTGNGRDGRTRYYDLTTGMVRQETETGRSLLCRVGMTDRVLLVQESGDVCLCEASGLGRSDARLPLHPGTPSALAIAPDGQAIACGNQDGSIRFINAISGKSERIGVDGTVHALVYSPETDPNESKLAVTTETWNRARREMELTTTVYGVEKHNQVWRFQDERIVDLAWSPDGSSVATVGDQVMTWDGKTGDYRDEFDEKATTVVWVKDAAALALGSQASVDLIDAKTGDSLASFEGTTDTKRQLAWSKAAGMLAATSGSGPDAEIVLLAPDSGTPKVQIPVRSHDQPVIALGWQSDGKVVLSGSRSETCTWDADSKDRIGKNTTGSQAFSADGTLGILAGPSVIRVHHPQDRGLLRTILIFSDYKYAVISPEGNYDGACQPGDVRYVVQTQEGQATLDEGQFAAQYGWKNDKSKLAPSQP